jgi:16S rRNA (uracil1498-N3)-methyltransferase
MHRFFVPPTNIEKAAVYFPMEISRQIATVLHLRPGQQVVVLDDAGTEYEVALEIVAPRTTQGRILGARPAEGEPLTHLTLYLGLTQREKFEWMLQKCTEIGAAEYVPVITSRSLVQSSEENSSKLERWRRILKEAAEQSGRGRIPTLAAPLRWNEALDHFQAQAIHGLIAWEEEKSMRITPTLDAMKQAGSEIPLRLALFIGPEGGFSEEEIAQARAAGLAPVTLGKRILRMETAAIAAAAIILHELET